MDDTVNHAEKVELEVRRRISNEINNYRVFLQKILWFVLSLFIIIIGAAAYIFIYLQGENIQEIKDTLKDAVEDKVIEYQIAEALQKRIEQRVEIAANNTVKKFQIETKKFVDEAVAESQPQIIDLVRKDVGEFTERYITDRLETQVREEVQRTDKLDFDGIVRAVAFPSETIVATSRSRCPKGWSPYKPASGRVIIGAGSGEGLTPRALNEIGGSEFHRLTIEEIPQHDHGFKGVVNGSKLKWGGEEHPVPIKPEGLFPGDWLDGGGRPHNNMPPYIVLQYCKKD